MSTPDERLAVLAAAIADGRVPDWDAASAEAESDEERAGIDSLRAIATIGQSQAVLPRVAGPDLAEGATWGGLRILGHIGRGRFGDVYRAWDPRLERDVALKILRAPSPESVSSDVVNEARLMARVRHPNVVAIYGAERIEGRTGLWMEFVPGKTLEAELKQSGPFAAEALRHVGVELCRALDAVHRAGLIHRDVKAHNMLRDRQGRLVLGDFGTGHELDEPEADRIGIAGTPSYLAPEIFRGAPASPQSDLYSLGVLLFHLATSGYPVVGRSIREIREAHTHGLRESIRMSRPDLPASLVAAIDRALDPDPARRFDTAAAFEVALGPARPWWRHGVVIAAGLALVGAGVVAGVLWVRRDASPGGLALTEIDRAFQMRVIIRAPSANPRFVTCSAWGRQTVALCDLVKAEMSELRVPATRRESAFEPLLSPDGRTVAYLWDQGDGRTTVRSIRLIGADGKNDRELRTVSPGSALTLLKWTRDGRALVASVGAPTDRRVVLLSTSGDSDQELWKLTDDARVPDLSPDERFVAFVRPAPGLPTRDIVIGDRRTGEVTSVTSSRLDDARPVFTGDGRGIVFVSDRSGSRALYLQRLDSGQPVGDAVLLSDLGRSETTPLGVSADGTIFLKIFQYTLDVYRATLDLDRLELRQPERVEAHSIDDSAGADWSPDGNRFAHASGCVLRSTTCENRLRIRTSDGRVERDVPLVPTMLPRSTRVRWAPDGTRIAMLYDIFAPRHATVIDIVDVRDGGIHRLTEAPGSNDIRWDHGGAALYSLKRGEIDRIDAVTGKTAVYYRGADLALLVDTCSFDVSRTDGSLLLMAIKRSGERVVRVLRADGSAMDRAVLPNNCYALAWGRDARTMFYSVNKGPRTPSDLWMMPANSGDARQIRASVPDISDIAIHPDGGQVLFSAGNPQPFVWTLSGLPR